MKGWGKREIPEKTPSTSGIIRHDSHMRISGVAQLGIETAVSLLASLHGDSCSIPGRVTPDFRMWKSCRTMPFGGGGFPRGSPVSRALSFWRYSILTSFTHIGSQDVDKPVIQEGAMVFVSAPGEWLSLPINPLADGSRRRSELDTRAIEGPPPPPPQFDHPPRVDDEYSIRRQDDAAPAAQTWVINPPPFLPHAHRGRSPLFLPHRLRPDFPVNGALKAVPTPEWSDGKRDENWRAVISEPDNDSTGQRQDPDTEGKIDTSLEKNFLISDTNVCEGSEFNRLWRNTNPRARLSCGNNSSHLDNSLFPSYVSLRWSPGLATSP
ncbi:hypothetical protein PR048_027130 [Dryococelus australis]|uniref:Uncharacterized protein n=1 Tax=Dryococelus australis TaxID=614101 RepID=A0ABQ9GEK2_9NEOP|nr:hypothetical protein PR048_027130 [Dryococelus australis]